MKMTSAVFSTYYLDETFNFDAGLNILMDNTPVVLIATATLYYYFIDIIIGLNTNYIDVIHYLNYFNYPYLSSITR